MNLAELKKPFSVKVIHWRVGRKTRAGDKAQPFAYIDARDVMERLDEVCGIGGWQAEYPFPGCCRLGVKVGTSAEPEWVWKTNGCGLVLHTQGEKPEIFEMKEKAQYSDAFKRAAVLWGIGQFLYDLPKIYVPVGEYGFEEPVIADLNNRYESWAENYFKQKEGE